MAAGKGRRARRRAARQVDVAGALEAFDEARARKRADLNRRFDEPTLAELELERRRRERARAGAA